MRKLSAAGSWLLLLGLGLLILGTEEHIRRQAGLFKTAQAQERPEETARRYYELYENIWKDLEYFPIPQWKEENLSVTYENSWLFERTYGGTRGHEGTDLMPPENESGVYPVISISDGTVESVGKGRLANRCPEHPRRIFLLCPSFLLRGGVPERRRHKCGAASGLYGRYGLRKAGGYFRSVPGASASRDLSSK